MAQEEEQGELMKDFVGALYPDSKTKIPPMPSFQQEELDVEDILALLRRCMGCIDQVRAQPVAWKMVPAKIFCRTCARFGGWLICLFNRRRSSAAIMQTRCSCTTGPTCRSSLICSTASQKGW